MAACAAVSAVGLPASRLCSPGPCRQSRAIAAPRQLRQLARAALPDDPPGGSGWQPAGGGAPGPSPRRRRPQADPELLEVLELATDEELEQVHALLAGRSLFSPLVKSLVAEREEGLSAAESGREALILAIDRRLRFLAADSRDTLRGRWPPYRQVLLMVRDKLGIRCSTSLLTNELEAEVFLALLERHADAVVGAEESSSRAAAEYASVGDGGAAAAAAGAGRTPRGPAALLQRLLAPLRLGQDEVVPALGKLGSALAVSNLQQAVLSKLGGKLLSSHVRYEAALSLALSASSKGVSGGLSAKVAVQAAKEGVTAAAARYAAARSLLGLVGPLMWASTALDLLLVSVGTDWSRVVKAVFALAQIRLLRTYGFSAAGSSISSTGGGS
ncbi:hypothetical protein ABPG75_012931 [Micractinium tetrahymenae]